MDLTRADNYYPLSAEKFKAVAWTMETKLAEFERLYGGMRVIRMTPEPERALVVAIEGTQRQIQMGEVLRVNQLTGAMRVMTQEDFLAEHGVAQS
jgi:hypothetical protein